MTAPFFTIITATCNAAAMLPRLLNSLACQTCRDFELIIQDDASSDNTVAIAESYRDRLPALSLVSEPDTGIYDAWNKALPRIRGEWALFLGADDGPACTDTLERCKAALKDMPPTTVYAGGCVEVVSKDNEIITRLPYDTAIATERIRREMPFPHQGLWHRRTLFENGKGFDASFAIAADYDFICRTWTRENGNAVLRFTVARAGRGGISDRPENVLRLRWENAVIAARHFPGSCTWACAVCLLKACLLRVLCACAGKRDVPRLLDAIRRLRGLPPAWKGL
ncbi:MAG: glycosyltransferase [Desulfovibrio sp.]|jgi:glycosyltransferase involved in cell wall biosynthesis|nr:glycosyltransferase [Desulfovibrio sp.]